MANARDRAFSVFASSKVGESSTPTVLSEFLASLYTQRGILNPLEVTNVTKKPNKSHIQKQMDFQTNRDNTSQVANENGKKKPVKASN